MHTSHDVQSLSDEALIEYVRTTDVEAYSEVIRRYQTKLLRYAQYLVGDDAQAADIVQESFIKVYKNLHGFAVHKKFSSWIYRIVHNQAMNTIKKDSTKIDFDMNLLSTDEEDLTDAIITKELLKHTHACIAQMPVMYREPLTLYFLEEKEYAEISDILRIPLSTVGTRIRRAKTLLRKICRTKK